MPGKKKKGPFSGPSCLFYDAQNLPSLRINLCNSPVSVHILSACGQGSLKGGVLNAAAADAVFDEGVGLHKKIIAEIFWVVY